MQYKVSYREKDKGIQIIVQYKDKSGQWKQKSKQGLPNKKTILQLEADKIIDKIKADYDYEVEYNEMTIGELKKIYLEHVKMIREYNTYQGYTFAFSKFKLDNIKIKDLKTHDIQKCVDKMVSGKLMYGSIKQILGNFKAFLNYISSQFDIKIPSLKLIMPKDKGENNKKTLSSKEVENMICFYKNRRSIDLYITTFIAAKTGLRIGEISGLTWDDIDFKNNAITVNKQWKIDKDTGLYAFGELKSKNSYRVVPISKYVTDELNRLKQLGKINRNKRLIASENTYALNISVDISLQENFKISIHELRHTRATELIANGLDFKTVARILGHDARETISTYTHVTDQMMDKAKNLIEYID